MVPSFVYTMMLSMYIGLFPRLENISLFPRARAMSYIWQNSYTRNHLLPQIYSQVYMHIASKHVEGYSVNTC